MIHSTTSRKKSLLKKIAIKAGVILTWLLLWQLFAVAVNKELLMPTPEATLTSLVSLVKTADFWLSIGATLLRIVVGCAAGIVAGTLLAAATFCVRFIYEFLHPVITVIRATPVASFIILLLVWIKRDYVPAVISFLMVLPIVWANVSEGLARTDKNLLETARVFSLSKAKTVRHIYIPQTVPYFVAACNSAIGLSWKAGVAAEALSLPAKAVGSGLYYSKIYLETPELFAWTATVIVLSIAVEKLTKFVIARLTKGKGEKNADNA